MGPSCQITKQTDTCRHSVPSSAHVTAKKEQGRKKEKKVIRHVHKLLTNSLFFQDKKDFIEQRVKRLLKAGVTSALTVMVKADNSILTEQTKEMLARYKSKWFIGGCST